MANSKNTIQNIPLASELCMNALKTEVKQFQGYNEKNTTLYGGTLSPIYDKTTELFDKDNSYTIFNSKGEDFTLALKNSNTIALYKGREIIGLPSSSSTAGRSVTKTEKLDIIDVEETLMVAKCPDGTIVSIKKTGELYIDNVEKAHLNPYYVLRWGQVLDCQILFVGDKTLLAASWANLLNNSDTNQRHVETRFFVLDADKTLHSLVQTDDNWGSDDTLVSDESNKAPVISFYKEINGVVTLGWMHPDYTRFYSNEPFLLEDHCKFIEVNVNEYTVTLEEGTHDYWYTEDFSSPGNKSSNPQPIPLTFGYHFRYIEATRFCNRYVGGHDFDDAVASYRYNGDWQFYVPITSVDDIQCPIGAGSLYYLKGNLISIGSDGMPIAPCLSYTSNIITPYKQNGVFAVTYKSGNSWYCFSKMTIGTGINPTTTPLAPYLKNMIIDNRYVHLSSGNVIDIEHVEDGWKTVQNDWILSTPVLSSKPVFINGDTNSVDSIGVVYGAGFNAGYMVNNAKFVGYLPNPYIGKVFNATDGQSYRLSSYGDIQSYFTIGDTAQAAVYNGSDPEYEGTLYPIDPNGNVVLPISQNAEIIKGYSNNDLVKEGNTAYPLMYWNNNQKTYSYMLLSGMENVTDVFSLQGQQYAVDDENIYAISFSSGVISNVNAVAYKKNLTFLGTLPTQAVFWSDFNKTFYAFTGDRILSKMFEASDINEIHYVGQNPSSLSLWVCTDTGIYVLSDTDQFRLDFNSSQVNFMPQKVIIVAEGETNNEAHYISLYLKDGDEGEMIPVKLETSYYGLGNEMKAVMDCWYLRLFDENNTKGYVKAKVHTITDITRHTEEKTFEVNPSDYDENHIVYLRFQPKYQECVSMQLELETNLGIYQISLGVNTTDSTAQVSKFNF